MHANWRSWYQHALLCLSALRYCRNIDISSFSPHINMCVHIFVDCSNTRVLIFPFGIYSPECKPILEDRLSEVAASLLAAYDSGELLGALEEGQSGWQKWVKSFGKSIKRKVCYYLYNCPSELQKVITIFLSRTGYILNVFVACDRGNLFSCR